MKIPKDMTVGSIHKTNNYGDIKVVSYKDCMNVVVKFVGTGFVETAMSSEVRRGNLKDKLTPSVRGVGFVGAGNHKPRVNGKHTQKYKAWVNMLTRCYCKIYQESRPTYIGTTVCTEWLNFQSFADWYDNNYIDGHHLDKDITQKGVKNKIYSPSTCIFVTMSENSIESHAKSYTFKDPLGDCIDIYNMSEFCKINNLDPSAMSKVNRGNANQYKGWTKVQ